MKLLLATLTIALAALPAHAEVTSASASGFVVHSEATVAAPPEQAWRALTQVQNWWNSEHTYSKDARNLRLNPTAGGCWCERFGANSVEHGRVIAVLHANGTDTLRISTAMGPLQEMAVNGVLTFTITGDPAGAKISMTYRVAGDPALNLDHIAPIVDQVLSEQFARLGRYTSSGRAN